MCEIKKIEIPFPFLPYCDNMMCVRDGMKKLTANSFSSNIELRYTYSKNNNNIILNYTIE